MACRAWAVRCRKLDAGRLSASYFHRRLITAAHAYSDAYNDDDELYAACGDARTWPRPGPLGSMWILPGECWGRGRGLWGYASGRELAGARAIPATAKRAGVCNRPCACCSCVESWYSWRGGACACGERVRVCAGEGCRGFFGRVRVSCVWRPFHVLCAGTVSGEGTWEPGVMSLGG